MADFNTVTEGNAVGKFFYGNVGFDISAATNLKIDFTTNEGEVLSRVPVVGLVDIIDPDDPTIILAAARQYLEYEWILGDIPVGSAGPWKAYPSFTLFGVDQKGNSSACFIVLAKDACG